MRTAFLIVLVLVFGVVGATLFLVPTSDLVFPLNKKLLLAGAALLALLIGLLLLEPLID